MAPRNHVYQLLFCWHGGMWLFACIILIFIGANINGQPWARASTQHDVVRQPAGSETWPRWWRDQCISFLGLFVVAFNHAGDDPFQQQSKSLTPSPSSVENIKRPYIPKTALGNGGKSVYQLSQFSSARWYGRLHSRGPASIRWYP